jgi:CubicO group peptidase (beta-lactamase class C family)
MANTLAPLCVLTAAVIGTLVLPPTDSAQAPQPAPSLQLPRTIEGIAFGADASLMFLTPEQQRVAYRNLSLLAPHNLVSRGGNASPLPQALMNRDAFRYSYQNRARSLDDFLTDTRVAGFLVIKNGRVVAERYAHGHTQKSVWVSFSVAKSVLSLLYGAALADGSLESLDDTITQYLPQLRGSAYDEVRLRDLLQMSSGVAWNEDETDRNSDLARTSRVARTGGMNDLLAYMKRLPRKAPSGSVFNYNTGETNVAGALLRAATRKTLAEYLSERIWKPAGMEADAYWLLMRAGDSEYGGCCISATLRDYGRLGLLALRGGTAAGGTRILPEGWVTESTRPAPTARNYGYLWWLEGGGHFAASGSFGQYIYVVPEHDIVVAIQSLWPTAITADLSSHRRAFLQALAQTVSEGPRRQLENP